MKITQQNACIKISQKGHIVMVMILNRDFWYCNSKKGNYDDSKKGNCDGNTSTLGSHLYFLKHVTPCLSLK